MNSGGRMKKYLMGLVAGMVAVAMSVSAAAYNNEPKSFGDMRWGDGVKKVSERYQSQYLENTVGGGMLYAVHFTDFATVMGIQGPLTVMASFDEKGKLVQINVPMTTDSEAEAADAYKTYTGQLKQLAGAPDQETEESAFWQGKITNIFVQKRPEGILVSFVDAVWMKKKAK